MLRLKDVRIIWRRTLKKLAASSRELERHEGKMCGWWMVVLVVEARVSFIGVTSVTRRVFQCTCLQSHRTSRAALNDKVRMTGLDHRYSTLCIAQKYS